MFEKKQWSRIKPKAWISQRASRPHAKSRSRIPDAGWRNRRSIPIIRPLAASLPTPTRFSAESLTLVPTQDLGLFPSPPSVEHGTVTLDAPSDLEDGQVGLKGLNG